MRHVEKRLTVLEGVRGLCPSCQRLEDLTDSELDARLIRSLKVVLRDPDVLAAMNEGEESEILAWVPRSG